MTNKRRDLLIIALIITLALVAFGAGFFANDLIQSGAGRVFAGDDNEEFSVFWEAWDRINDNFIGDIPTSQSVTYGAIRGSVNVLEDPYTTFIAPAAREIEKDRLRGNIGGIGATISKGEDGLFVLMLIPGNPAEKAGVLNEDILLAVDGRELTPDMTIEDVVGLVRGEEGTEVTLRVLHSRTGEQVDITIVRAIILLPSVTYRLLAEDPSIGYIQLSRFSGESSGEVEEAILALAEQGAEKLILDLRHNGGGLLDAAIDVSDLFLDGGPVLHQISKNEDEKTFTANAGKVAGEMPLVVLIDGGTASSSEIVAGALQDRERAILIGMTTFGKGSVQLVYDLSDGSSIHVTSARWFTPDRHQIDQHGLQPDIPVEITEEAVAAGQDEILMKAIEHLQG